MSNAIQKVSVEALVKCAIPYEALLADKESRKWIAPSIWTEIEDAVKAIRGIVTAVNAHQTTPVDSEAAFLRNLQSALADVTQTDKHSEQMLCVAEARSMVLNRIVALAASPDAQPTESQTVKEVARRAAEKIDVQFGLSTHLCMREIGYDACVQCEEVEPLRAEIAAIISSELNTSVDDKDDQGDEGHTSRGVSGQV